MKNEHGLEKDDILPKKSEKTPGEEVIAKEDLKMYYSKYLHQRLLLLIVFLRML